MSKSTATSAASLGAAALLVLVVLADATCHLLDLPAVTPAAAGGIAWLVGWAGILGWVGLIAASAYRDVSRDR